MWFMTADPLTGIVGGDPVDILKEAGDGVCLEEKEDFLMERSSGAKVLKVVPELGGGESENLLLFFPSLSSSLLMMMSVSGVDSVDPESMSARPADPSSPTE